MLLVELDERVALVAVARTGNVQRGVVFRVRVLFRRGVKGNMRTVLVLGLWLFHLRRRNRALGDYSLARLRHYLGELRAAGGGGASVARFYIAVVFILLASEESGCFLGVSCVFFP